MHKIFSTLVASAAVLTFSTFSASAVPVSYGGKNYDVTTVGGSFNGLSSTLMAQVWWGDGATASAFATSVGDAFGLPLDGSYGPLFAYDTLPDDSIIVSTFSNLYGSIRGSICCIDTTHVFAVATEVPPVPLPAGGLLLLTGLAGVAGLGRRKQRAA